MVKGIYRSDEICVLLRIGSARASCAEDLESILGRVKPKVYTNYTYCFLAWRLGLLEYGKDWFAQCQENATGWDFVSW